MPSNNIYSEQTQSVKTKEFIRKAKLKHGERYEYSLVEYVHSMQKVEIICKEHGGFEQTPNHHLSGNGCRLCHIESSRTSQDDFIKESNTIHDSKYDYSEATYINANKNIIVICKSHGKFKQRASYHLSGGGCPKCSYSDKQSSMEDFINSANFKHSNKFTYGLAEYVNMHTKITITCPKHGNFEQSPLNHINGSGCPKCSNIESKIATKWLDSLNIPHLIREHDLPEYPTYKPVDGYDPETNTVYQFHGDYWHGNLNNPKFKPDDINRNNKKTFGELNRLTNESDDWIRSQGYNLVVMWELDFNNYLDLSKIKFKD
jgi:hypothetical protein